MSIVGTLARLWPARAEVKASRAGALIAFEPLGQPVWAPRDYAAFAREGFMQNAVVYRSVRMVAEAAASVPLLLYDGAAEIEDHPLLDLIARPSLDHTGTDFFEAWYGFLLVAGNAYVEAVGVDGRVRELHALRPDRMKVIPGPDGWPQGYEYTLGGRSVRFTEDPAPGVRPILHLKLFHPANDHYGMSPIEAAAVAIDVHNEASKWNKALLDNSARPSGALVYAARDGCLTGDQFERLKGELAASYQGAKHAGRPLLLEGGLDWKPLSLSPKDMDFVAAKNGAAREIALALGVPPMLLGIPGDNTYSNYQEANRSFWRQTVLPLVHRTAKALAEWLSPAFGGRLALRPDLDQIEALTSEREVLWARIEAVTFLSLDEKRAAVGYGPAPVAPPPSEPVTDPAEAGTGGATPALEDIGLSGALAAFKYRPDQPRVPAGDSEGGQWTDGGGGGGSNDSGDKVQVAARARARGPVPVRVGRRTLMATPQQVDRLSNATSNARSALDRIRELDPNYKPRPSLTETVEGEIAAREGEAREAEARLREITRDAAPGTNPSWGANRLEKELYDREFRFSRATDSPGKILRNPQTGEEVRIMKRPESAKPRSGESPYKYHTDYYYRYRPGPGKKEGSPIPIPNKPLQSKSSTERTDE